MSEAETDTVSGPFSVSENGARIDDESLREQIMAHVSARGAGKTICPSEVARALASDWRPLMLDVRRVAHSLALEGALNVTQKAVPVDAMKAKGPIRLGLPPA